MSIKAKKLIEKTIEYKMQLDSMIISGKKDDEINLASESLLYCVKNLMTHYNEEFSVFLDENPKYRPLKVIAKDNLAGYKKVISSISNDVEQTVIKMIQEAQSNEFFRWVNGNIRTKVVDECESKLDELIYSRVTSYSLPKVKQEEMGDCLALAFTGILSRDSDIFEDASISDADKVAHLHNLMYKHRRHIYWDYLSGVVEDRTSHLKSSDSYEGRSVAPAKYIDSTYTDGTTLFAVLSTNTTNTSSQRAQVFEINKVLRDAYQRGDLILEGGQQNLRPEVIIFNKAFFCTQDYSDVRHDTGSGIEVGYHPNSVRYKFDRLFEKPLSKLQLDKINSLVTLSMLGNEDISYPRFPSTFEMSDLADCNPVTAGADTLWLYTEFEKIKIKKEPEKTVQMFSFLLDYSNEVMGYLNQIKENCNEPVVGDIKSAVERMLEGISRNFNEYNLGRPVNKKEREKLEELRERVIEFNDNQPNQAISPILLVGLSGESLDFIGKNNLLSYKRKMDRYGKKLLEQNKIKDRIVSDGMTKETKEALRDMGKTLYSYGNLYDVNVANYFESALENLQKSIKLNCDYLKIPKKEKPKYHYVNAFLNEEGSVNVRFLDRLKQSDNVSGELLEEIKKTHQEIKRTLNQFHTDEGRESLINSGGLDGVVGKLYAEFSNTVKNHNDILKFKAVDGSQKKKKRTLKYH